MTNFLKSYVKSSFREDLLIDERFKTNLNRCEHYKALKPEIEKWSVKHTIKEAVDLISDAGVPLCSYL